MSDVQDKNRSSSDEEPDYMSEKFLQQCTSNDVRPSLLHSRAEKRKHDVLKRQLALNKTKTEKDKDMLRSVEDALKVPISEDNKGFKMLQKMGYRPGSSIGKDRNDSSQKKGITTPIGIELKHGRGGLGREQHELEKHQHKLTLGDPAKYRARQQNAALAREIFLDLKKAQFACQSLDEESEKTQPVEIWYWPKIKSVKGENDANPESDDDESVLAQMKKPRVDEEDSDSSSSEEEEEDIPEEEKLVTVANYLRSQYSYCLWCATRYDDDTDMQNSCPGTTKDDH